jgi:hypothetical protein
LHALLSLSTFSPLQIKPSGDSDTWYSVATAISSDGSGSEDAELAAFGFIGAGALQVGCG